MNQDTNKSPSASTSPSPSTSSSPSPSDIGIQRDVGRSLERQLEIWEQTREMDEVPGHELVKILTLLLLGALGASGWVHDYEHQIMFLISELRRTANKLEVIMLKEVG